MKKQVSKMNDKELDDFFKKLSLSPEIPFVPQDWNNFEKLLPKNNGIYPINGSKWILLLSLSILGLLLAGWFTVLIVQQQVEVASSPQIKVSPGKIFSEPNQINHKQGESLSPSSKTSLQYNVKKTTVLPTNKLNLSELEGSTQDRILKVGKITASPIEWDKASKWSFFKDFNQISPPKINPINLDENDPKPLTESRRHASKNKIAFMLLASPDYSATQFNHMPSSGINFGANLEYFIKNNWSISAGLIHSQKTYSEGAGYWEGYNKAHQSLVGDCWIIEVPINLRYYPLQKLKHKWFVSTGLSSYFMLKEKYVLQYENYKGKSYSESFEIVGSNQHLFGIWNVGFGYEQKLGKNFSVQAEPYFRIPLVGVGEGNLALKSMGIFFGIKYYPFNYIGQ